MNRLDRRRFLCVAMPGGVLSGFAAGLLRPSRAAADPVDESGTVQRQATAMGAEVHLVVRSPKRDVAAQAADAALRAVARVDRLMSLYRPQSQLCQLNRDGVLRDPHPWLVDVLRRAADISRQTGGAFDVTVQPLWDLYAKAHHDGHSPSPEAIEAARAKVDWQRVDVSPDEIRLRGKGMAVTLNGLAQGYAADRAAAALRTHRIHHALIDTGEVATIGGKSDDEDWQLGIQHPRRPDAYVSLARLNDRCLATSGDYATRFDDDYKENHLFDPQQGKSPGQVASASVAAATATEADGLATAMCVLGLQAAIELADRLPGVEALVVAKDGRVTVTRGFPQAG